jgi:hypothetical protein
VGVGQIVRGSQLYIINLTRPMLRAKDLRPLWIAILQGQIIMDAISMCNLMQSIVRVVAWQKGDLAGLVVWNFYTPAVNRRRQSKMKKATVADGPHPCLASPFASACRATPRALFNHKTD